LIYTDMFKSYDALVAMGFKHERINHRKGNWVKYKEGISAVHINGIEGFWSVAKERLFKNHGVKAKYFPLYLKEQQYRYNYRDEDLFDNIINLISEYYLKK